MKQFILTAATLSLVSACTVDIDRINPAVSQFNGDSVNIQLDNTMLSLATDDVKTAAFAKADAEAVRICAKGSKRRAEFTSTRVIPTGQYTSVQERLYLCLN